MKIFPPAGIQRRMGNVLVITLIVALLLGLSLTSYLLLARAQSVSIARSQAWHAAMIAAEAGVEEALAQLNATPFATNNFDTSWKVESWGYRLTPSRTLAVSPPLGTNWYTVCVTSSVPPGAYATIGAQGYATVPLISATISRSIQVETVLSPLFAVGAATKGRISMNGKKIMTDSFDSTSIYQSNNGKYDSQRAGKNGDIASLSGFTNTDKAEINGKLLLGATATNRTSYTFKVDKERVSLDFNADFPNVPAPVLADPRQPLRTVASGETNYFLSGNNYQTNSVNGAVFVTNVNANAVLYVTGDVNITKLEIASGASLKLYVSGGSTTFGDVKVLGTAKTFQYYGLPGNSNINLAGYDIFTGTIYAPNATFRAGNKSSPGDTFQDVDFHGALIVNSIDMRSDLKLHFDESLKKSPANGPIRGYVVKSWQELPPP